jgi:hypothetical protein
VYGFSLMGGRSEERCMVCWRRARVYCRRIDTDEITITK